MDTQQPRDINIGQLIKQIVDERHWSYADFARAINCSRSSIYNIFNSRDISFLRLLRISEVLDYDFIGHLTRTNPRAMLYLPLNEKGIDTSRLPPEILELLARADNGAM